MNEEFNTSFEDDEAWLNTESQGLDEADDEGDDESIFAEDYDEGVDDESAQDTPPVGPATAGNEEYRRAYSGTTSATDARLRALRDSALAKARYQNRRAAHLANTSTAQVQAIRPMMTSGSKMLVAQTPRGLIRMRLRDGIVTASQFNKFVEATTGSLRELRRSELRTRVELARTTKTLASQQASMTNAISKEVSKAQKGAQGDLQKQAARLRKLVKDSQRRQTLNSITLATSIPLFRAYGDSTSPFSTRNLTLLGATLAAIYADDLLQTFTRGNTTGQIATAWSYGAPLLLAGGVHLALKDAPSAGQFVLHPVEISANTPASITVSGIAAKKGATLVGALGLPAGVTGATATGEVDKDGKLALSLAGAAAGSGTALLILRNKT